MHRRSTADRTMRRALVKKVLCQTLSLPAAASLGILKIVTAERWRLRRTQRFDATAQPPFTKKIKALLQATRA